MTWQNLAEDLAEEFEQDTWSRISAGLERRKATTQARQTADLRLNGPRRKHLALVTTAWKLANPDRVRKHWRTYRARHPEKVVANQALQWKKRKAKKSASARAKRYREANREAVNLRLREKRARMKHA